MNIHTRIFVLILELTLILVLILTQNSGITPNFSTNTGSSTDADILSRGGCGATMTTTAALSPANIRRKTIVVAMIVPVRTS